MISKTYNRDCVEAMKEFKDNHFDLAVVDPPYGIDVNSMNMGSRKTVEKDPSKKWDKSIPTAEYFKELFRVSKNQIIWGGNYFIEHLTPSQYFCIWDKGETMYGRDFAECEFAWVRKGGTRIFKKNPNQLDRIHVTQKPVALYDWIFQNYAKEGDLILDTHLGSQSSRIAAHKNNLDFIGYEIDADYFNEGNKRYELFASQLTLF